MVSVKQKKYPPASASSNSHSSPYQACKVPIVPSVSVQRKLHHLIPIIDILRLTVVAVVVVVD